MFRMKSAMAVVARVCAVAVVCFAAGMGARAQSGEDCDCADIPMIKYRLEEAARARDDFSKFLNGPDADGLYSDGKWKALTQQVQKDVDGMQHSGPKSPYNGTPGETDGFWGWCTSFIDTPSKCMRSILDSHESIHRAACEANPGVNFWKAGIDTMRRVLDEEVQSYQTEIDYANKVLKELACKCQRFGLLVRHETNATVMGRGATVDLHRFLNSVDSDSGQGLMGMKIPIFVTPDGQVEGDAQGNETGWGNLLARGARGDTSMDAKLTVEATGTISPGQGCTATGCSADDMLHVTLRGEQGANTGVSHVQVGGFKKTLELSGGGGDGQMQFDLPAYVGETAEATIVVPGTAVEAKVGIQIISLDRFGPLVTDGAGASLLWTAKECEKGK